MSRKWILSALAGAATIVASSAIAQHAHGGGPPAGGGGSANAGGFGAGGPGGFGAGAGPMGNGMGNGFGTNGMMNGMDSMRAQGRLNSQGAANASATGIAHANENSVLYGTTPTTSVTSGALTGLTTGTTLYSNGTAVGTVEQIRTTGKGSVAVVVIKGTNGGYYAVPANKLAYSGGTLSTNATLRGINSGTATASAQARANSQGAMHASATGIAHANQHSVLYGASTGTTANSISVGMPLVSSTGSQLGTVYRVVTGNGIVRRVLVQGTNGRMYSLAPNTLTASSSGSLTTTTNLRGM